MQGGLPDEAKEAIEHSYTVATGEGFWNTQTETCLNTALQENSKRQSFCPISRRKSGALPLHLHPGLLGEVRPLSIRSGTLGWPLEHNHNEDETSRGNPRIPVQWISNWETVSPYRRTGGSVSVAGQTMYPVWTVSCLYFSAQSREERMKSYFYEYIYWKTRTQPPIPNSPMIRK
jgi:hypothetical protein